MKNKVLIIFYMPVLQCISWWTASVV